MKPIELAAYYTIGAIVLYTFTEYAWVVWVGMALAISAFCRYIYTTWRA